MSAEEGGEATEPRRSGGPWRRRGVTAGIVVVAVALPLWLRAGIDGAAQLRAADEAAAEGSFDREVEHLGRALRWRAPLWSHDEQALERLWAIGEAQQARGAEGRAGALAAYRELRRGLLATRAWGIPHRERWEEANARIAGLMAEQERALGLDASGDGDPVGLAHGLEEPLRRPRRGHGHVASPLGQDHPRLELQLVRGHDPKVAPLIEASCIHCHDGHCGVVCLNGSSLDDYY